MNKLFMIMTACTALFGALPAQANDSATAQAAIAAAKTAQESAAAVGGEWRDTGLLIKTAEEEAAKGNYGNAVKTADVAAFQGKAGGEQAHSQVGVGNPAYLDK